jgi:GT2 family glycosyltransferase
MKLVSILYLTIDRYPSCIENLKRNLANCGVPRETIEVLWCDNGSQDKRVVEEMTKIADYAHVNKENCGISRMLNQLIIRSTGQCIFQLGNDYEMPDNWLKSAIEFATNNQNVGMVGIAWCPDHVTEGPQPYGKPMFGPKLKTRALLDEVGAFDEMLSPYGLEDSDYHQRAVLAGFNNYYLPNIFCKHLGGDVGEKTAYRQMKDMAIRFNGPYFVRKDYKRFGYYISWPAKSSPFA